MKLLLLDDPPDLYRIIVKLLIINKKQLFNFKLTFIYRDKTVKYDSDNLVQKLNVCPCKSKIIISPSGI